MNKNEMLNMPSGNKLDILVELYVFKWPKAYDDAKDIPHYSTDISAAWEVVEKSVDFELSRTVWSPHGWECGVRFDAEESTVWGKGNTAPLAICRAALLAVMEDIDATGDR